MTDGVSVGVDRYEQPETWPAAFALAKEDPADLLDVVTSAEATDADRSRWPRSKTHDDKSAVIAAI